MTGFTGHRAYMERLFGGKDRVAEGETQLREFALLLVEAVQHDKHIFDPRKHRIPVPLQSSGWAQRHRNYSWAGAGLAQTRSAIEPMCRDFAVLLPKIQTKQMLTSAERGELIELCRSVFDWGGVKRGNGKENPDADVICAVIRSAIAWRALERAPTDSGWTKVAAFATSLTEADGMLPQVIYDSRVSASLVRLADRHLLGAKDLRGLVLENLRLVPGRSETRGAGLLHHWKSGYKSWDAQFFTSLLVAFMRDELNKNLERYGRPDGKDTWSVRDVEMVLFMDGY